jgi:hypothetical protein
MFGLVKSQLKTSNAD